MRDLAAELAHDDLYPTAHSAERAKIELAFDDASASKQPLRVEVESDPDQRRVLSWLLRKHFERHLFHFKSYGLILEEGRKRNRRAYFEGRDGRSRKLVYDTPRRKAVSREVVKQRGEPRRLMAKSGPVDGGRIHEIRLALVGPDADVRAARPWILRLNNDDHWSVR